MIIPKNKTFVMIGKQNSNLQEISLLFQRAHPQMNVYAKDKSTSNNVGDFIQLDKKSP